MTDVPTHLTFPSINLNGSSPDTLVDDLRTACVAMMDAIEAVARTVPNGRDYQTLGPDAFPAAQHEHAERMASLHAIQKDLEAIAIHILNQTP